jgi:nucleotide-binding universal stress UspA family protein
MTPRLVVGVDGRLPSLRALTFALSEARLRGAVVDAVIAWHEPYTGPSLAPGVADPNVLAEAAAETLDRALADVHASDWGPSVDRHVVRGRPGDVLVQSSDEAALIVVGSRGRSGITGVLLGSVAQQLVRDASCPVVVVPSTSARRQHHVRDGSATCP